MLIKHVIVDPVRRLKTFRRELASGMIFLKDTYGTLSERCKTTDDSAGAKDTVQDESR